MATKSIPAVDRQKAYVAALKKENFKFGLTVGTAFVRGIRDIGYHCRDYFVGQWERFRDHPWGELAHSTHLRGAGTWDAVHGERPRVTVTLATGIPADEVAAVGLDHLDPGSVDPVRWAAEAGTLVVADAGEELYRLAP